MQVMTHDTGWEANQLLTLDSGFITNPKRPTEWQPIFEASSNIKAAGEDAWKLLNPDYQWVLESFKLEEFMGRNLRFVMKADNPEVIWRMSGLLPSRTIKLEGVLADPEKAINLRYKEGIMLSHFGVKNTQLGPFHPFETELSRPGITFLMVTGYPIHLKRKFLTEDVSRVIFNVGLEDPLGRLPNWTNKQEVEISYLDNMIERRKGEIEEILKEKRQELKLLIAQRQRKLRYKPTTEEVDQIKRYENLSTLPILL